MISNLALLTILSLPFDLSSATPSLLYLKRWNCHSNLHPLLIIQHVPPPLFPALQGFTVLFKSRTEPACRSQPSITSPAHRGCSLRLYYDGEETWTNAGGTKRESERAREGELIKDDWDEAFVCPHWRADRLFSCICRRTESDKKT